MSDEVSAVEAIARIRERFAEQPRALYVAGCAGSPRRIAEAFSAAGAPADGQTETFEGVWIPGIDTVDWAGLHDTARARSIFVGPAWRGSFETGRFAFQPHTYAQTWRRYSVTAFDAAFAMVTPPDAQGEVSLGVSADFTDAALRNAKLRIALVNPHMPRPADGVRLPADLFDLTIAANAHLPDFPDAAPDPAFDAIGRNIAQLAAREGARTLQLGLGKVQAAVLQALATMEGPPLRLHAGMVSDSVLGLIDAGRIADAPRAITCGVALGTAPLYERAAADRRFRFRPVGFTHAAATLAGIDGLMAVNSAIEVDLFGQANAEFVGGRQISGGGGLTDFLAGAQASEGGLAVIALVSSAKSGSLSRIVPRLEAGAATAPRTLVDLVVTEHGIADCRGLDLDARAETILSVAAPDHRDALASAWAELRRRM